MVHKFVNKKTRRGSKQKERVSFCVILGQWEGDEKTNKQTLTLHSTSAGGKVNDSAENSSNFKTVRVFASRENIQRIMNPNLIAY
jgi:hypothetical protein